MKATKLLILATITICSFGPVHAEEDAWYAGIKAGRIKIDNPGFETAVGVGGILGYKLNNTLGIEGGYTTIGKDSDITVGTSLVKWDLDVVAVHLAYRTEGNFFAKGKAGLLYQEVTARSSNVSVPGSGGELSVGAGVGWRPFKDIALELEYTHIEKDISFISFNINLGI